jgi:hypothetical protein
MIVANDLRIEEDSDIPSQWVCVHVGYTLQLGQQALHYAGHFMGAFDFGDIDPDPSIKDVAILSAMHRRIASLLRDSPTW